MAKVRAKERGFDNIKLREPGEEFEHDGPLYHWLEVIGDAPASDDELGEDEMDEAMDQDDPPLAPQDLPPPLVEPPRKKRIKK